MTTILVYVYWPLLYFTVYVPFIIPRLNTWNQIPFLVTGFGIFGFVALLAACGMRKTHKSIFIHSFGVALFLEVFIFAMSRLSMPGFLKSYENGFLPDAVVPILILGIIMTTLGESGRFASKWKRRTSNQASQTIGASAPQSER